jgi:hypothetical protein
MSHKVWKGAKATTQGVLGVLEKIMEVSSRVVETYPKAQSSLPTAAKVICAVNDGRSAANKIVRYGLTLRIMAANVNILIGSDIKSNILNRA